VDKSYRKLPSIDIAFSRKWNIPSYLGFYRSSNVELGSKTKPIAIQTWNKEFPGIERENSNNHAF
jgi:hypothetical protein